MTVGAVLLIVGLVTLSWPTWAAGVFVLVISVVADEHHKRGLRRLP
jgi:membrane protein implicated in regulation of membrane protease activity